MDEEKEQPAAGNALARVVDAALAAAVPGGAEDAGDASPGKDGAGSDPSDERAAAALLGEAIRQSIDDGLRARMTASGLDEVGAVRHLMELERFASTDPAGYLRFVAHRLAEDGHDVGAIIGLGPKAAASEPSEAEPADRLSTLQATVERLAERLRQDDERRERAELQHRVDAFRNATDDDGALRHPHHRDVAPDMARLLRAEPSLSLEDAYEQALWLNPGTRRALLNAELARHQTEAETSARQEALGAARADRLNVRPGARPLSHKPNIHSLDDAIAVALRDITA